MGPEHRRSTGGKLQGAARHWLNGAGADDNEALQAAADDWGIELPQEVTQARPDVFDVWPENWPAVELFVACQTQWRVSMGHLTGLDYSAVAAVASLCGVVNPKAVMRDLQIIELTIMAESVKGSKG